MPAVSLHLGQNERFCEADSEKLAVCLDKFAEALPFLWITVSVLVFAARLDAHYQIQKDSWSDQMSDRFYFYFDVDWAQLVNL